MLIHGGRAQANEGIFGKPFRSSERATLDWRFQRNRLRMLQGLSDRNVPDPARARVCMPAPGTRWRHRPAHRGEDAAGRPPPGSRNRRACGGGAARRPLRPPAQTAPLSVSGCPRSPRSHTLTRVDLSRTLQGCGGQGLQLPGSTVTSTGLASTPEDPFCSPSTYQCGTLPPPPMTSSTRSSARFYGWMNE